MQKYRIYSSTGQVWLGCLDVEAAELMVKRKLAVPHRQGRKQKRKLRLLNPAIRSVEDFRGSLTALSRPPCSAPYHFVEHLDSGHRLYTHAEGRILKNPESFWKVIASRIRLRDPEDAGLPSPAHST